jgi:hypothetical protein
MRKIGKFNSEATSAALRGAGWKLLKQVGLTSGEIEDLVEQAKRDVTDPKYRWFYTL